MFHCLGHSQVHFSPIRFGEDLCRLILLTSLGFHQTKQILWGTLVFEWIQADDCAILKINRDCSLGTTADFFVGLCVKELWLGLPQDAS